MVKLLLMDQPAISAFSPYLCFLFFFLLIEMLLRLKEDFLVFCRLVLVGILPLCFLILWKVVLAFGFCDLELKLGFCCYSTVVGRLYYNWSLNWSCSWDFFFYLNLVWKKLILTLVWLGINFDLYHFIWV